MIHAAQCRARAPFRGPGPSWDAQPRGYQVSTVMMAAIGIIMSVSKQINSLACCFPRFFITVCWIIPCSITRIQETEAVPSGCEVRCAIVLGVNPSNSAYCICLFFQRFALSLLRFVLDMAGSGKLYTIQMITTQKWPFPDHRHNFVASASTTDSYLLEKFDMATTHTCLIALSNMATTVGFGVSAAIRMYFLIVFLHGEVGTLGTGERAL